MEISCCMIVRNEIEVLDETLRRAVNYFNEIVVVDTGSMDGTQETVKKYTGKAFFYKWNNNFSDARNYSISKAANDFVFILDADERISRFDGKEAATLQDRQLGTVRIRNSMDNGLTHIKRVPRLFNRQIYAFSGEIHEQLVSLRDYQREFKQLNIEIDHIGYMKEVLKRTNKLERNIELLLNSLEGKKGDPYLLYQLGKSYGLQNDLLRAAEVYESAIEKDPSREYEFVLDLIISYGYTLLKLKKYKQAMKLEQFTGAYSHRVDFCFLMGLIYMNNGSLEKSVQWFERCMEMEDGDIEGTNSYLPAYNLGVIYECLSLKDEAKRWYMVCGDYPPAEERIRLLE